MKWEMLNKLKYPHSYLVETDKGIKIRCTWLICLCLPPDKTWHKVNDPKVGL